MSRSRPGRAQCFSSPAVPFSLRTLAPSLGTVLVRSSKGTPGSPKLLYLAGVHGPCAGHPSKQTQTRLTQYFEGAYPRVFPHTSWYPPPSVDSIPPLTSCAPLQGCLYACVHASPITVVRRIRRPRKEDSGTHFSLVEAGRILKGNRRNLKISPRFPSSPTVRASSKDGRWVHFVSEHWNPVMVHKVRFPEWETPYL